MTDFNEKSPDAMFARVLARLDEQDRAAGKTNADFLTVLNDIRSEARKTNGRITSLERWRDVITAKTAMIAAAISIAATLAVKVLPQLLGS